MAERMAQEARRGGPGLDLGWSGVWGMGLCLGFGVALILNTQMEGEASWFWYGVLLHRGVRLYAQLHLPLQPLFVLETDGWMRLFGRSAVGMGVKSLLHVMVLAAGLGLVLRRAAWARWMRGVVLVTAFAVCVQAPGYRFDDYHVVAQSCIVFSVAGLLALAEEVAPGRQAAVAAGLGVLAGLALTTRLNDGAALLVASAVCAAAMARGGRVRVVALVVLLAVGTTLLVVLLTGDTLGAWFGNSVLRAAASKGGTGSVLWAPARLFWRALEVQATGGRRVLLGLLGIGVAGWLAARLRERWSLAGTIGVQLVVAGLMFAAARGVDRRELLEGSLITDVSIAAILACYIFGPVVLVRWIAALRERGRGWDRREVLLLVPLAEMGSASASTAGEPFQGFYLQTAICLVLVMLLFPERVWPRWGRASFVTLAVLLGVSGVVSKYREPYTWQKYDMARMFTDRVWFRDPAVGPLYLERDSLALNRPICEAIDADGGRRELLSLPYSYPNYFCGIVPWRGYVQTYFDTSTRATMEGLMRALRTDPPRWIVYQRQMEILRGQERTYNHWRPLPQRELDELIMSRVASGEWRVVETSGYLGNVGGWMLLRTGG